jgi:hypothetical protein
MKLNVMPYSMLPNVFIVLAFALTIQAAEPPSLLIPISTGIVSAGVRLGIHLLTHQLSNPPLLGATVGILSTLCNKNIFSLFFKAAPRAITTIPHGFLKTVCDNKATMLIGVNGIGIASVLVYTNYQVKQKVPKNPPTPTLLTESFEQPLRDQTIKKEVVVNHKTTNTVTQKFSQKISTKKNPINQAAKTIKTAEKPTKQKNPRIINIQLQNTLEAIFQNPAKQKTTTVDQIIDAINKLALPKDYKAMPRVINNRFIRLSKLNTTLEPYEIEYHEKITDDIQLIKTNIKQAKSSLCKHINTFLENPSLETVSTLLRSLNTHNNLLEDLVKKFKNTFPSQTNIPSVVASVAAKKMSTREKLHLLRQKKESLAKKDLTENNPMRCYSILFEVPTSNYV